MNQLAAVNGAARSYDARGNLVSDGSRTFAYSVENMLNGASGGLTLNYDPLLRLNQVNGASVTKFGYDGTDLIAECDGSNQLLRRHVHGPGADEPLVTYEGTGTSDRRFLHADERGSIVAATDNNGAAVATNRYDEYGAPHGGNSGRFQYTGQVWLPELGLYYYKARMYDPVSGRFPQADPIGYDDGMNMYAYVGGDPVNFTDSSGQSRIDYYRMHMHSEEGRAGSSGAGRQFESSFFAGTLLASGHYQYNAPKLEHAPTGAMDDDSVTYKDSSGRRVTTSGTLIIAGNPSLTGRIISGANGEIKLVRQWSVKDSANGIVVQEVSSSVVMDDGRVFNFHFYEAWQLRMGRWEPYGNTDEFGRVTTDVSSMRVTATARFYNGIRIPSSMRPGAVPQAGGLPSSRTAPTLGVPQAVRR